jgi:hypothetical protein
MAEFASKGVAGTALGLGAGSLGVQLLNGGFNGLLGMGRTTGCCSEDHMVNRYEAAQQSRISELETEVKLRDANTYTDQKLLEVYNYFNGKVGCIENQIAQQAVYNATNTATLTCLQNQVAQLASLTKVVIPTASICPEPMPRYNSWTAPAAPTTT